MPFKYVAEFIQNGGFSIFLNFFAKTVSISLSNLPQINLDQLSECAHKVLNLLANWVWRALDLLGLFYKVSKRAAATKRRTAEQAEQQNNKYDCELSAPH